MKRKIIILILTLLMPACSLKGGADFTVSGKVARSKKPQSEVDIFAYQAESLLNFEKTDSETKTDADGKYSLSVSKEGDYYITAKSYKKGIDEVDLFGYYGRNPVYVQKNGLVDVNLNMQKVKAVVSFEKSEQPGIKCVLTHNGQPLSYANVFVAVDLNEGMQTKGFVQSDLSDENGECNILVDLGRYYLTARKRVNDMFGPMSEGDLIGFFHGNPVVIDEPGVYTVNIELVEIPKRAVSDKGEASKTTVIGRVLNEDGDIVSGLWVGAYLEPQMFGKPAYISGKSDANGVYTLTLAKAGKYYLAARDTLGGPPNPGELYGSYNGTDDHSVTIKRGETLTDIDITVREMW